MTPPRETHPRLRDALPPCGLTASQLRVIAEVTRHATTEQAAAALGITLQTAKNHLSEAYYRLGVTSFTAAVNALGWFRVPGDEELAALAAGNRLRHAIDEAQTVLDRLERAS